jgi:hypothetical protein
MADKSGDYGSAMTRLNLACLGLLVAMTPHEAPLVLTHWERFDKLSIR